MRAGVRVFIVAGALACLVAPSVARADVTCSVVAGTLQVASGPTGETMRLGRVGDQITVVGYSELDLEPVPITCSGPAPTVAGVESISVRGGARPFDAKLILDLTGGPLAPGATSEADGSSEIELNLDRVHEVVMRGGASVDQLAIGVVGPSSAANLNAGEAAPDVDVLAPAYSGDGKGLSSTDFTVAAGGGSDFVTLAGGTGFTGPATYDSGVTGQDGDDTIIGGARGGSLVGGAGSDYILGGRKPDFLGGGKGDGRDTLIAGGGNDLVFGQGGRDLILGGGGIDIIASGRGRDRVHCGPQRDALEITTGRKDRRRGCELIISFEGMFN